MIDDVTYFFCFSSISEYNITVVAHIPYGKDDNNKYKEYYKINEKNEPPNLWVNIDVNNDGVIEKCEGRWAWY